MSTSFLVIQAQRDLAQAKTNELAAVLAYDLALVDFEALQQAGPRAPGAVTSPAGQGLATTPSSASLPGASRTAELPSTTTSPVTIPGVAGPAGGQ